MQSPREALSPPHEHRFSAGDRIAPHSPLSVGLRRLTVAAAVLLCAAYVIYFAQLTSLPLQDFPNHLARARIIDDLLFNGGAHFGGQYTVQLAPTPYVLHDLVLATLIHVFGTTAAAAVFIGIVLLSLPCALLFYMRVTGISPRTQLAVLVLSLFLSTDWFFLMGFLAFRLAVALVVLGLAMAESVRSRWSLMRYAMYVAVLIAGYLTHFSAPVFFLVVISISAATRLILRTSTLEREAQLVLPVVALIALHVAFPYNAPGPGQPDSYAYDAGRLSDKLFYWSYEFGRFGGRMSLPLMLMLALCVLFGIWRALRPAFLKSPLVVENLLIAAAFVGVYILLPRDYADAAYVDVRALSMITLFTLITSAWLSHSVGRGGYDNLAVRAFVLLVVAMNLGWVALRLKPLDHWMSRYREIVAAAPMRARVLTVSTQGKIGSFYPFVHAGSFLVLDREAMMPYLFSGNGGDPMRFFFYVNRPYKPHEGWYFDQLKWREAVPATYSVLGERYTWRFQYSDRDRVWEPATMAPVEWTRVACDYEWLLIAKPYDAQLIGVRTTRSKENEAAALMAIDKGECRPAASQRTVKLRSEH